MPNIFQRLMPPQCLNSIVSPLLRARRYEFLWLCGLILSFAYERPAIYVSSMDRVNPRLFDFVFFWGVLFILPHLRKGVTIPNLFIMWRNIVVIFSICALVWTVLILPWEYGKYSLYFMFKYIEALVVVYIAIKIPLDTKQKRLLHYLMIVGGLFVAIFTITEYLSGSSIVYVTDNIELDIGAGALIGPLGYGYYHLALFSGVSCILTLALVPSMKNIWSKIGFYIMAAFIAWPVFFSGSRTGPLFLGVALCALIFISRKSRKWILPLSLLIVIGVSAVVPDIVDRATNASFTFERFVSFEENKRHDNSTISRLLMFTHFDIGRYMWDGIFVPFIGGGFYVAPTFDEGFARYRVGYGFHNVYVFAFEQGGMLAFVFFVAFLVTCWKSLNRARHVFIDYEADFADAAFSIFIGMLVVGMIGHGFWFGSTLHFSHYMLLIYLIAGRSYVSVDGIKRFHSKI